MVSKTYLPAGGVELKRESSRGGGERGLRSSAPVAAWAPSPLELHTPAHEPGDGSPLRLPERSRVGVPPPHGSSNRGAARGRNGLTVNRTSTR